MPKLQLGRFRKEKINKQKLKRCEKFKEILQNIKDNIFSLQAEDQNTTNKFYDYIEKHSNSLPDSYPKNQKESNAYTDNIDDIFADLRLTLRRMGNERLEIIGLSKKLQKKINKSFPNQLSMDKNYTSFTSKGKIISREDRVYFRNNQKMLNEIFKHTTPGSKEIADNKVLYNIITKYHPNISKTTLSLEEEKEPKNAASYYRYIYNNEKMLQDIKFLVPRLPKEIENIINTCHFNAMNDALTMPNPHKILASSRNTHKQLLHPTKPQRKEPQPCSSNHAQQELERKNNRLSMNSSISF